MSIITSTDSVPNITNYEKYNLAPNIINFYNINKEYLIDIFTILLNEMLELTANINELNTLFQQIKNHPIIIEEYKIICETAFNKIIIKNFKEINCYVPINCIQEIKIKNEKENNTKYITIFNYQLAMLLLSTNKYIYCYKNEKDEEKENPIQNRDNIDDNNDEISIISNVSTLAYEINKNKTIYTTDRDVYRIDQLIESINNRNNDLNDPNFFINGINSYNFKELKKIDFFYTNIDLSNSLVIGKKGFFIYNKEIGLILIK